MKKIYINENKINLVIENSASPDSFDYDGERFSCYDYDAIPFIYDSINNIFYYCNYNGTHWDLKRDITAKKIGYSDYSDFCDNIENIKDETIDDIKEDFYDKVENVCHELKNSIEGRFWIKNKFIAFWGDYVPIDIVNLIIKNIEKHFNVDYSNPFIVIGGKIIPYNEYGNGINVDVENDSNLRAIHLMNQKEKRNKLSDFRKLRGELDGKKLGNMTMAQYHNLIYQECKLKENYNVEIEPNEIDMTSFKIKNNLNNDIWDGDVLNSRVRLKLLDISDDFIEYINIRWVKPIDIILTGSICNYNWSKFSDIDIHIIIDFSKVSDKKDLVREYFNLKKNEWNDEHNLLEIYGFNVEFYVEDINDETVSGGIYSLEKNKWIKKPDANDMHDIDKKNDIEIRNIASNIINKIDNIVSISEKISDKVKLNRLNKKVDSLLKKIKKYRKKSLDSGGELSNGNIVYKILRRTKYLNKLWDLKIFIYDKINSIN